MQVFRSQKIRFFFFQILQFDVGASYEAQGNEGVKLDLL